MNRFVELKQDEIYVVFGGVRAGLSDTELAFRLGAIFITLLLLKSLISYGKGRTPEINLKKNRMLEELKKTSDCMRKCGLGCQHELSTTRNKAT